MLYYWCLLEMILVLILAKAMLALMIGFILAIVSGLILIPLFRRKKVGQQVSLFVKKHIEKQGIPTMGGFIFIFPTVLTIVPTNSVANRPCAMALIALIR